MNETVNAAIAAILLGGLVVQCFHHSEALPGFGTTLRAGARALVGCGLFGYVLAPLSGQNHPGAQTALLVGLAVLLLVRWRRRNENSHR